MISSIRWRGRRVRNHGTIPGGSQGLEPSANFTRIGLSEVITARRSIIIDGSLTYADGSLGIQDQVALMSLLRDENLA